jgi:hypothetical protein
MRSRFLFWVTGLVTVLLVASCAPPPAAPTVDSVSQSSVPTETSVPQPTAAASVELTLPAPASQPVEVQVIATSRGPKLEATDPAIVSLASGQLQLIEFFRFT